MTTHLLIRLQGPLIAFGGETIDNLGVIRQFPAKSMLTGLLANALGWHRADTAAHNELQARLVFGARIDVPGTLVTDFQTAELNKNDMGWTRAGRPEGRAGGDGSYKGKHLRYRDFWADSSVLVACRLVEPSHNPTLQAVAQALMHPARPLFLGRKPCLPSAPLFAGWIEAPDILAALHAAPRRPEDSAPPIMWPVGEGDAPHSHLVDFCDERDWTSGVHGGWRSIRHDILNEGGTP